MNILLKILLNKMINPNHLGHKFIAKNEDTPFDNIYGYEFICLKCYVSTVYWDHNEYYGNNLYFLRNSSPPEMIISCDEQIIKNIIE